MLLVSGRATVTNRAAAVLPVYFRKNLPVAPVASPPGRASAQHAAAAPTTPAAKPRLSPARARKPCRVLFPLHAVWCRCPCVHIDEILLLQRGRRQSAAGVA